MSEKPKTHFPSATYEFNMPERRDGKIIGEGCGKMYVIIDFNETTGKPIRITKTNGKTDTDDCCKRAEAKAYNLINHKLSRGGKIETVVEFIKDDVPCKNDQTPFGYRNCWDAVQNILSKATIPMQ